MDVLDDHTCNSQEQQSRKQRSAMLTAGLDRMHDLRHSVASNLIAGGMGLLEVAHLFGHQSAAMVAQVYSHLAPDDHKRTAALMDSLLQRQLAAIP